MSHSQDAEYGLQLSPVTTEARIEQLLERAGFSTADRPGPVAIAEAALKNLETSLERDSDQSPAGQKLLAEAHYRVRRAKRDALAAVIELLGYVAFVDPNSDRAPPLPRDLARWFGESIWAGAQAFLDGNPPAMNRRLGLIRGDGRRPVDQSLCRAAVVRREVLGAETKIQEPIPGKTDPWNPIVRMAKRAKATTLADLGFSAEDLWCYFSSIHDGSTADRSGTKRPHSRIGSLEEPRLTEVKRYLMAILRHIARDLVHVGERTLLNDCRECGRILRLMPQSEIEILSTFKPGRGFDEEQAEEFHEDGSGLAMESPSSIGVTGVAAASRIKSIAEALLEAGIVPPGEDWLRDALSQALIAFDGAGKMGVKPADFDLDRRFGLVRPQGRPKKTA